MNKYLCLSAAALLAGTAGAAAATYTFTFGTSGGGSYCDGGVLHTDVDSIKTFATWTHTNNNCASGTSEGAGFLIKIKGQGKFYAMSDNFYAKNYGIYSEQLSYLLPAKPKNGAPWQLWVSLNGVSGFEGNSGVLNNVTNGKAHIPGKGTKSTASVVRQMIAAHSKSAK